MDQKTVTERKAHMAALQKILTRWEAGEITTDQKRSEIARENSFFYGRDKRSPSTGESLTTVKGTLGKQMPPAPAAPDPDPWGENDQNDPDDDSELEWWQK